MWRHLKWENRLTIERMLLKHYPIKAIAEAVGCSQQTIYNEIKRARYLHTDEHGFDHDRYNPDGAQRLYEEHLIRKGAVPKIMQSEPYRKEIARLIRDEHYSPEAAMFAVNQNGVDYGVRITSVATIYKAIRKGFIEGITMRDCPLRGKKKYNRQKVDRSYKRPMGVSIEERDRSILDRMEFGHWEMDSVMGKQTAKGCLLVMTERKTRYEIIEPLADHGAKEVVKALKRIVRKYNVEGTFKSITCDNGREFYDTESMSKIAAIYYAHPRSPFERGSNENQNKLVRRFYPKGVKIDLTRKKAKAVEKWINEYPRRQFKGGNSRDRFALELQGLVD